MMRKSGTTAPLRTLFRVLKFALAFLVDIVVADAETEGKTTGADETRLVKYEQRTVLQRNSGKRHQRQMRALTPRMLLVENPWLK